MQHDVGSLIIVDDDQDPTCTEVVGRPFSGNVNRNH